MNCHFFQKSSPRKAANPGDKPPLTARPTGLPVLHATSPRGHARAHARARASARLADRDAARTARPTGRPIVLAMTRGKDAGRPMGCRAGPAHSQQGSSSHIRHNLCQESQRKIYFYNRLIENSHVQRVYRSCTGKGGLQDHR